MEDSDRRKGSSVMSRAYQPNSQGMRIIIYEFVRDDIIVREKAV